MLTKSQKAFCDEYVVTNKRTDAYMKAFPRSKSRASASAAASRLLANNRDVQAYLASMDKEATNTAMKKAAISKERVLSEEGVIAFLDPIHILDENGALKLLKDMPEEIRRGIQKITETTVAGVKTYKIEFYNKGQSLDRLEKCLKMQREGIESNEGMSLKVIVESIDGGQRGKLPHES